MRTNTSRERQAERENKSERKEKQRTCNIQLYNMYSVCGHFAPVIKKIEYVPVQVKSCDFCIVSLKV